MRRQSLTQITSRTLDYLARRHPWFGAILRQRLLAISLLTLYAGFVVFLMWQVHEAGKIGWLELIKTYSGLFFDLLILFVLSTIFLIVRGYYSEEASRIDVSHTPDARLFLPLRNAQVLVQLDSHYFFTRHPAMAATLDALPLDQSDFFLAHAGSLDIPKLTLRSIKIDEQTVTLQLGTAAFKEFFFSHHFADYRLSRSSSNDIDAKATLRSLYSPMYEDRYLPFFTGAQPHLQFLDFTPNTMGVTGCVRVTHGERTVYFLQRRGYHESAARRVFHLSYAGTLDAYPRYVHRAHPIDLDLLAKDEFDDEFMTCKPGQMLTQPESLIENVQHELVGICANSHYLYQPELFMLTTIRVHQAETLDQLLEEFAPNSANKFWAFASLEEIPLALANSNSGLRPMCQIALDKIYRPLLASV